MKKNKSTIFCPAWMLIIVEIKYNRNMTEIQKKFGITYSHVTKVVNQLIERDFVVTEYEGRVKNLSLTFKGLTIATNCEELLNRLKQ